MWSKKIISRGKMKAAALVFAVLTVIMLAGCVSTRNSLSRSEGQLGADTGGEVTFYITRHGRTMFNTVDRAQGWADTPLTPEGIAVAEALGRGVSDIQFHYVISSDLTRARQTARLVMAHNRAGSTSFYDESDMLREACYGSFEGEYNKDMLAAFSKAGGFADYNDFATNAGNNSWYISADLIKSVDSSGMAEDGKTIKDRMQTKLRQVAEEQAALGGGNVLLVAHGMSINIMLSDLDSAFDYRGTPLANAAVCKVVYKNGAFSIQSFNDTSYIEKGKL